MYTMQEAFQMICERKIKNATRKAMPKHSK